MLVTCRSVGKTSHLMMLLSTQQQWAPDEACSQCYCPPSSNGHLMKHVPNPTVHPAAMGTWWSMFPMLLSTQQQWAPDEACSQSYCPPSSNGHLMKHVPNATVHPAAMGTWWSMFPILLSTQQQWVMKHVPNATVHPAAMGTWWSMFSMLLSTQQQWAPDEACSQCYCPPSSNGYLMKHVPNATQIGNLDNKLLSYCTHIVHVFGSSKK